MLAILKIIQKRWSSHQPTDRLIGAIGKIFIEGAAAIILTAIFSLPLYLVDMYIVEIDPFFTKFARDGIPILILAFLATRFSCDIILDLRDVDQEEEKGEKEGQTEDRDAEKAKQNI